MKTKIILLLLMMSSVVALAQNVKPLEGYTITPPIFTGVQISLSERGELEFPTIESYLKEKIIFPEAAQQLLIQGTVVVGFVVTPQGELSDIKLINSVSPKLDDEVIRALLTTNRMWRPGIVEGEAVSMDSEISVAFVITDWAKMDFKYLAKQYFSKGTTMLFVKNNPAKALRSFEKGIVLMPNDKSLLLLTGITRYEMGDKEGAIKDWTRIKKLGGLESSDYIEMLTSMKGYGQMSQLLQNK